MSTVIILSSSPPPVFARSPTPADLSSPCKALTTSENCKTPSRRRFKTRASQRDGFSGSFTTARQVLAEKNGELNKIISCSPGRNKFKANQSTNSGSPSSADHDEDRVPGLQKHDLAQHEVKRNTSCADSTAFTFDEPERSKTPSPLIVQRAVSRRMDWTPPKPDTSLDKLEGDLQRESSFLNNLLGDFVYKPTVTGTKAVVTGPEATKRRKTECSNTSTATVDMIRNAGPPVVSDQKVPAKRNKSPTKKSLTITGLATSNFLGQDRSDESPMLQYLTSTQEQTAQDVSDTGVFETKVKQTKAAVARIRQSKKGQPKSLLVSPSSALKFLNEQEAVFGSASQLANVNSTAGGTVQRQSDPFDFSDPFSSPLSSQAKSIESATPQVGISRFRQSRNLWAAAGRDEDNALLHVDTVDLTDTPIVRQALTGKDAMVQPSTKQSITGNGTPSIRMQQPSIQQKRPAVLDIDDVTTPGQSPLMLGAPFHTAALNPSPRKQTSLASTKGVPSPPVVAKSGGANKKKQPKKPHYAGLSDHDLKKQITSYGFKAVKKREKMIELLEKCWTEKHGQADQPGEPTTEKSGYGDILSHIHDVSARALPKEKKVAKPRKKKDDVAKTPTVKKPRQKKTKSPVNNDVEPVKKPVRKRKFKADAVAKETVYDIDDLDDPLVKERRELGRFDDWAKPPKTPQVQETAQEVLEPPTPPLTFPEEPDGRPKKCNPPSQLAGKGPQLSVPNDAPATPADSQLPDIFAQITRAINHESFTSNVCLISPSKPASSSKPPAVSRNHQTHPTWHEKILMYDPIVLEDLAVWLNTKGLSEIGEDREVSALEVRTWCESRGICCLWKGGWRGQKGVE